MFTISLLSKIQDKSRWYSILLPVGTILNVLTSPVQLSFVCIICNSRNPEI